MGKEFITAKRVKSVLIASCFFVVFSTDVRAQAESQTTLPNPLANEAPTLRFEHLAQEQGLAQVTANALYQDSQGFIWVGTQGGLHRYDGTEFKVFNAVPFDTTSLSDNWIWATTEASNGDMWIGTEQGGLNRMDRATGTFKHYRHDPNDSTSISTDRVFYPFEDSRGNLWVSTLGNGLNKMKADEDGVFKRFQHVHDDATTLSGAMTFWISEDTWSNVWVGTSNGISRIDIETDEITRILFEPDAHVGYGAPQNVLGQYLPPTTPEVAWLATGNGLVRLNLTTLEHERFLIAPSEDGEHNPLNFIHEVTPDPLVEGVYWVAGPGTGIARFDESTGKFTSYRHDPRDENSLSDNDATSIMTDRSGTIWVGTANAGLNAFNPGAVNFAHLRNDPDDDQSLAAGNVWGVYEDSEGTMWVGSDQGSLGDVLTQFDARTGKVTRHRGNRNDPRTLHGGSLRIFGEDSRGNFYVGGGGGFSRLDRRTGRAKRIQLENIPENRGRLNLFAILPASDDPDIFWLGSFNGLQRFDTRTEELSLFSLKVDSSQTNEPIVLNLLHGGDGTLWVGTYSGLYSVQPETGSYELVTSYDVLDPTTISDNFMHGIVERDSEPGILWIATSQGGLNRFDTATRTTTHFTQKDGLPNNTLYSVLEDDSGTLWMSTNNGISNFDPDTGTFRNYGLDDGLMSLEYNQNAYWKGSGGVLYFGSANGVTAFSPERLRTNETPPQLAFTDFKIYNKSVAVGPDSPLKARLAETESITLDHDQNEITFGFVALHFANPEQNTYAYKLEGHDEDWIDIGTNHAATFTNLKNGDYTFRVKAANADGVWNEEGISIGLTITPPWWRTWFAYLLYAGLLGVFVVGIDRTQRRRLARKEQERTQIREAELRAQGENRRREDAERLSAMGRAITSTLSTREIIDTVYENVNAMADAAIFGIGIYDPEHEEIDFPATKENGETLPAYSYSLNDPSRPAVWSFKNRQEFVVGDFAHEYQKYLPASEAPVAGGSAASIIYLPLIHQDKAVGVITTQSFEKNAYSDYHISVLRTLAAYAAIAIDNAAAYRKLASTLTDLRATQQQLVQSEKMASLGTLTAGIAHEIKNPLNFINNFAEVNQELAQELREAIANGEDVSDLVADLEQNAGVIAQHGKRADSIVHSMMQHASGGTGRRELTDVNALVAEHTDLAYHGKRVQLPNLKATIERNLSDDTGSAEMIPQEIGRVLLNLVGNAFDAVYEHGTGSESDLPPTVSISTKRTPHNVEIRVADNGPGIPPEIRERIFEPFFTTKPTGLGTGLGLSLSHDIVTQGHGGSLVVESSPGHGATFIVTLPINGRH